jgi:hypothetical protein
MQRSAIAELRRLGRLVNEQDARAIERASEALAKAVKMLHESPADTFLGRKTQAPFPKLDGT